MSTLSLARFFDNARMGVSSPDVDDLPTAILGPEDASRLEQSLSVDSDDDMACAASARLWENLLENHRIPFLMLRVADMRSHFDRKSTAIELYKELAPILDDEDFTNWVDAVAEVNDDASEKRLTQYKSSKEFTPSLRWRSTKDAAFPHSHLPHAMVDEIRNKWNMLRKSGNTTLEQYLNMNCIETNAIEGTLIIDSSATTKLIQAGFYNEVQPAMDDPVLGEIRDSPTALSILQDTRNALNLLFDMVRSARAKSFILTTADIQLLHKELMRTSIVMCLTRSSGSKYLAYVSPGITRQTSQINVTATTQQVGGSTKVQYCPFDCIEDELEAFCENFNSIINMDAKEMDPFAAAAWISFVFLTIHPFEDGNGRVSRLLASFPLLLNDLPPLNIPPAMKSRFIEQVNHVRANRDGFYADFLEVLHSAVDTSLSNLEALTQDALKPEA